MPATRRAPGLASITCTPMHERLIAPFITQLPRKRPAVPPKPKVQLARPRKDELKEGPPALFIHRHQIITRGPSPRRRVSAPPVTAHHVEEADARAVVGITRYATPLPTLRRPPHAPRRPARGPLRAPIATEIRRKATRPPVLITLRPPRPVLPAPIKGPPRPPAPRLAGQAPCTRGRRVIPGSPERGGPPLTPPALPAMEAPARRPALITLRRLKLTYPSEIPRRGVGPIRRVPRRA